MEEIRIRAKLDANEEARRKYLMKMLGAKNNAQLFKKLLRMRI